VELNYNSQTRSQSIRRSSINVSAKAEKPAERQQSVLFSADPARRRYFSPASMFRVDLYHRSRTSDHYTRGFRSTRCGESERKVSSVAGIFATFAEWEAEIYKLGHAVIHDKILVIDPFTDDSIVVTGSHNLGFKASYVTMRTW
jgi:phosphatidylserine/phosphatidylglycerophosphate/cardiolipin synthase-like enzyme